MIDDADGEHARNRASGGERARPRSAVLAGLRWLWRRGNRARRYAKLKRTLPPTPAAPTKPLGRPADDAR